MQSWFGWFDRAPSLDADVFLRTNASSSDGIRLLFPRETNHALKRSVTIIFFMRSLGSLWRLDSAANKYYVTGPKRFYRMNESKSNISVFVARKSLINVSTETRDDWGTKIHTWYWSNQNLGYPLVLRRRIFDVRTFVRKFCALWKYLSLFLFSHRLAQKGMFGIGVGEWPNAFFPSENFTKRS